MVKQRNSGFPGPFGSIISSEVFRCREIVDSYRSATENFREQLVQNMAALEIVAGKTFGDLQIPFHFFVRSRSWISQPGMMDSLLNVGNNEEIIEGIAVKAGKAWVSWDNYRRFMQSYGLALGLQCDDFDAIVAGREKTTGYSIQKRLLRRRDEKQHADLPGNDPGCEC